MSCTALIGPVKKAIYGIHCKTSGATYVGRTVNLHRRWRDHHSQLTSGTHDNSHLQRAWSLYGVDAFYFTVLEPVTDGVMAARESYWINFLGTMCPSLGYNLAVSDGRVAKVSDETRQKLSRALTGIIRSPETRHRMSVFQKSRGPRAPLSPHTRNLLSRALRGRTLSPEHRQHLSEAKRGHTFSEEHRQHMAEARLGRTLSEKHRQHVAEAMRGRKHSKEWCQHISEGRLRRSAQKKAILESLAA